MHHGYRRNLIRIALKYGQSTLILCNKEVLVFYGAHHLAQRLLFSFFLQKGMQLVNSFMNELCAHFTFFDKKWILLYEA